MWEQKDIIMCVFPHEVLCFEIALGVLAWFLIFYSVVGFGGS